MPTITKHHVMAALIDAGVNENEADSFIDGVTMHNDTPEWSRELLHEYREAQEKAENFERAYDILYGPKAKNTVQ